MLGELDFDKEFMGVVNGCVFDVIMFLGVELEIVGLVLEVIYFLMSLIDEEIVGL